MNITTYYSPFILFFWGLTSLIVIICILLILPIAYLIFIILTFTLFIIKKFYPYHIQLIGDGYTNKEQLQALTTDYSKWNYLIVETEEPINTEHGLQNLNYKTTSYTIMFRREEDAVLFRMSEI